MRLDDARKFSVEPTFQNLVKHQIFILEGLLGWAENFTTNPLYIRLYTNKMLLKSEGDLRLEMTCEKKKIRSFIL